MTRLIVAILLPAAASAATNVLPAVAVAASPVTSAESVAPDGLESATVSRAQLSALGARDVQTALRQIPGLTISRYSPVGSYGGANGGSVYVRGAGTARPGGEVKTYTDGAPRESGMWGHPLMDSMPTDFADSVSVAKNPHPAKYPGSFGAVETQTRRRSSPGAEAESELALGRHGTFLASASAGAKEGPADAYAGASYKHSDGVRDHNRACLKSAFARAGWELSPFDRASFVYQRTESSVEDPGEISRPTPRTDRFDLETDLYLLRFDTSRDRFSGFSLLYFEHGLIDWFQDNLCNGTMDGNAHTRWLNFGVRNFYEANPWQNLWISAALDFADENGETETRNLVNGKVPFARKGGLYSVSPYLGVRYGFELPNDFTLTPSAGARRHLHSVYESEWAPSAALSLDWKETFRLFANASRGVHYPGVYTLAVSPNYAKDTLDAETMDYFAAGAKFTPAESFDLLATLFRTDVRNRIDKTSRGYVNSGGMRATGLEISSHWSPADPLALYAAAAFAEPDSPPVSRLPRHTFTAGSAWQICDWLKWSIDGQYIGSMYAYSVRSSADLDLRPLEGDFLFNTRLAVPLESFLPVSGEIYASIENFTDRKFEYTPGYPIGGAMWYLGCRVVF